MARRQLVALDARAGGGERRRQFLRAGPGAMGSFSPDRISTGTPERSGLGGSASGAMARSRIAPASASGCKQQNRGGDVRAVRIAEGEGLSEAIGGGAPRRRNWRVRPPGGGRRPRRTDPRGSAGRSGACRLRARSRAAKEAPPLARPRGRAAACRSRRRRFRGEAEPADGSGRRRARNDEYRRAQARSQASAERELRGAAHISSSFGSAASMAARRLSRNGGNLSACPSESGASSMAKPGGSVAISNSTRPGSRK